MARSCASAKIKLRNVTRSSIRENQTPQKYPAIQYIIDIVFTKLLGLSSFYNNMIATKNLSTNLISTTFSSTTDPMPSVLQSKRDIITIGVSIAILLLLSTILIIIVVVLIWSYKRRLVKQELYTDSSYFILSRESGQQIQSQSIQNDSAQLYDQIHLSPSTGQTEFIPKPQSENVNNPLHNSHPTHLNAENYVTSSAESQTNPPLVIYAAVDKNKKKVKKSDTKCIATEKNGPPVSPYTQKVSSTPADKGAHAGGKDDPTMSSQKSLDDMHASDHKDQEKMNSERESNPPHTVEELYTAVKKKPKGSVPKDEKETPPIPPHTVEELYRAVEKKPNSSADENKEAPSQTIFQNTAEDLYTAVMKMPKDGSMEAAPPLPPHTVEELYTAVVKKPKENAEDEEKAPPIPPYTVEEN